MGREASTAPKERINVTFKPATGGAVEEIELPMKVTVLGDFRQTHDDRNLLDRKPVGINRNNFADVMGKQGLSLSMAVPKRLQDDDDERDLQVNLKIGSMRDFEPENIIAQVPELKKISELRQALITLKGPLGNLPAFRAKLEDIIKDTDKQVALLQELQAAGLDVNSFPNGKAPAADGDGTRPDSPEGGNPKK